MSGSPSSSPVVPAAHDPEGVERIPTNTWPMWVIAVLPLAGLLTGVVGLGAPVPAQGPAPGLRITVGFVPLVLELLLAAADRRTLAGRGILAPLHWGWAVLDPIYVIGRSVVVRRRARGSLAPLWLWLLTSAAVATVHLLLR